MRDHPRGIVDKRDQVGLALDPLADHHARAVHDVAHPQLAALGEGEAAPVADRRPRRRVLSISPWRASSRCTVEGGSGRSSGTSGSARLADDQLHGQRRVGLLGRQQRLGHRRRQLGAPGRGRRAASATAPRSRPCGTPSASGGWSPRPRACGCCRGWCSRVRPSLRSAHTALWRSLGHCTSSAITP
jgi:hypothetical protein